MKIVLPSDVRLLDLAHAASEKMAELGGFSEEEALDLGLAVREAVVNAMVHGNRRDPALSVALTLSVREGEVKVRVADRGQGFDPRATADPREGDNVMRSSGRGILLIRAYVDDVVFRYREGRGMEVTLVKRVRKDEPAARPAHAARA